MMEAGGALLTGNARALGFDDDNEIACCSALQCYACAFLSDTFGLFLAQFIEEDDRKCSVYVFAKYIYSWPCRLCALCCYSKERVRTSPESNFF